MGTYILYGYVYVEKINYSQRMGGYVSVHKKCTVLDLDLKRIDKSSAVNRTVIYKNVNVFLSNFCILLDFIIC